jgi:hypothetical protein
VTVAIIATIAVVLVLVVGLLLFRLMKSTQTAVPAAADPSRPSGERVVGRDQAGRAITEAQELQTAPRDEGAFESLLQDEIRDRGMQEPPNEQA